MNIDKVLRAINPQPKATATRQRLESEFEAAIRNISEIINTWQAGKINTEECQEQSCKRLKQVIADHERRQIDDVANQFARDARLSST